MTARSEGRGTPPPGEPDHAGRRAALRRGLTEHGLEALVVSAPANVRYLTGFTGSHGHCIALAAPDDGDLLLTDGRYADQARRQCPDLELLLGRRHVEEALVEALAARGVTSAGFEGARVSWSTGQRLLEAAEEHGLRLEATEDLVESRRSIKDDEEVGLLRTACALTEQAFGTLLDQLTPGRTERGLASLLDRTMVDLGAEGPAFETIVAAGPDAARPHHRPTARPVHRGEVVKVDFGARWQGYHADMTRTVAVGEPGPRLRRVHDVVRAAQQAGVEAAVGGATTGDVDEACRAVIRDAGHGDHFVHSTGHGVGLDIHESPILASGGRARLEADMVVTVEPGIYLPGVGGVRIEDTVHIRARGAASRLTDSQRDLLVL